MGYVKRIVCLANSLKDGGLCIAGREVQRGGFGGWIRPVGAPPHAESTYIEYRYPDGSGPALLDLIDVPLLERMPHGHQTENHLIDNSQGWKKYGRCSFLRLSTLVERPATLWSNSSHTASGKLNCVERSEAAAEQTSLLLVDGTGLAVCVMPGRTGQKSFWGSSRSADTSTNFASPIRRFVTILERFLSADTLFLKAGKSFSASA